MNAPCRYGEFSPGSVACQRFCAMYCSYDLLLNVPYRPALDRAELALEARSAASCMSRSSVV